MYPVDMLKVRIVSCDRCRTSANVSQTRLQVLKPREGGLYTGFWNAFSKVRTIEGGSRMWKGVSSVIIGAGLFQCTVLELRADMILPGPAHALYFLTYENVKHAMGGNERGHHPIAGRKLSQQNSKDYNC